MAAWEAGLRRVLTGRGEVSGCAPVTQRTALGQIDAGAPIGNQNARKWDKQTDSPEFKSWFGDSKVVDKDGKPLVVYHGTTGDFSTFSDNGDKLNLRGGGYWFSTADVASEYATSGVVMPVYLKADKILDGNVYQKRVDAILDKIHTPGGLDKAEAQANKEFQAKGYDAIHYKGKDESGKETSDWMVFHPTQIKSAIGNKGTWSKTDPNITAKSGWPNA
jgi:hypothetical protein